ncbi:MAG TPA: DUF502 domain-containing protein [Polyangiaceae bacterium]|nr:DUF502 domain-containing protein [Polyangiaceae bacterium]
MSALLRYLAQGTLVAVPIAITLYVVVACVRFIDGLSGFDVPGLGVAATLALLIALGFVTSSVIGNRLVGLAERWLGRLPLVKILYSAMRDLVGAFVGDKKGFDRPVRVTLPGGVIAFGFATRETLALTGLEGHVIVYFPQSYNVAGNVVAVPASSVAALDVKSSELMSFIVSGGIAGLGRNAGLGGNASPLRGASDMTRERP